MFVPQQLARRIEAAEAELMLACAEHTAHGAGRERLAARLGEGAAVWVGPDSPMNKTIGTGFDGPIDAGWLAAVEQFHRRQRAPVQVELATLASPEAAAQLSARGYRLIACENVLGRPLADVSAPPEPELRAGDDDVEAWVAGLADAFLHADGSGAGSPDTFAKSALEAALRLAMSVPGMHRYTAHEAGTFAGGASMRLSSHGIAQLCGAGTAPPFRRRGIQGRLLRTRLADAKAAGCELAVLTTQPGSVSQQNAQRQGFVLLYVRNVLVLPAGGG